MTLHKLIRPAVVELGKIKIGGKGAERKSSRGGTYRAPEKYDHFVVTTLQRDARGDLVPDAVLMESLKEYADASDGKLRQLPVALLSNDLDDVLQAGWVAYQGKRLAARSDGEILTVFYDSKTGQWLDTPIEREWRPEFAQKKDDRGAPIFKLHSTLNVVIAARHARYGGFYRFRSTSQISASQLYGSLLHIQGLTCGQLRGLPLTLVVRPMQVAPEGKPTTVYVVHLELRGPDLQALQQQALDRARFELAHRKDLDLAQSEYKRLLHAPGHGDPESEAEAAEEYHPDVQQQQEAPSEQAASANGNGSKPPADPLAAKLASQQQQAPALNGGTPALALSTDPLAPLRQKVNALLASLDLDGDGDGWAEACGEMGCPLAVEEMSEAQLQAAASFLDAERLHREAVS